MVFAVVITLLLGYAFLIAKPNLPKISALVDYNPKTPLRIYTADKVLIGEFGEERRKVIPLNEIPMSMRNAVLAIEDDRFYSPMGVWTTWVFSGRRSPIYVATFLRARQPSRCRLPGTSS